jgi:SAM-dependent methyltransferase
MLNRFKRERFLSRVLPSFRRSPATKGVYGLEWGDPDYVEPLKFIRDRYVLPYVDPAQTAVEIGPGGGRWTRYLLGFRKLYVVDFHAEMLAELKSNYHEPNMTFVKNNGSDFPGIDKHSIDFVFSFDAFVHFDLPLIERYLANIKDIVKPGANIVIHYSDQTKIMAQVNRGFSDNTPEKMRQLIVGAGFKILEEDLTTMWHSSIARFTV